MLQHIGVLYHPKRADALDVARKAAASLRAAGVETTLLPAWDEDAILKALPSWQIVVTCGGDGTILRSTRLAAPLGVPQLGINLGRLGFLAELKPEEVADRLPSVANGEYWIEERAMLRATILSPSTGGGTPRAANERQFDALNEVLMARGPLPRVIRFKVAIDGIGYKEYSADGVVVATATGSTAYSLSAGGPVLSPESKNLVFTPICPHVLGARSLVLRQKSVVTLEMVAGFPGILSVDGQIDVELTDGEVVQVTASPYTARFVRTRSPGYFYELIGRVLP